MNRTLRLTLAFLACAAATTAEAQRAGSPNYIVARVGMFEPTSDDLEDFGFDAGFAGEIVLGRYLNPNLAGELGLGYFGTSMEDEFGEIDVSVVPITASAKFLLPLGGIEPYGVIGLGVYRSTYEDDDYTFGSYDDTAMALGLHFGGGMQINISPTAFLGADLRYVVVEPEFDAGDGTEFEAEIGGLQLNLAAGFRF